MASLEPEQSQHGLESVGLAGTGSLHLVEAAAGIRMGIRLPGEHLAGGVVTMQLAGCPAAEVDLLGTLVGEAYWFQDY
jgi:hypothetical protein